MKFEQWDGFTLGDWQDEINVRDFIQKNYTPYEGDSFFKYLTIGLVPLKDGSPEKKQGKTIVYSAEQASDFFEKVGRNTDYIINPEEILAENFAGVLLSKQAQTPELHDKIRKALKK